MEYTADKLDDDLIEKMRESWASDLNEAKNYFPAEIDKIVGFARQHCNYDDVTQNTFLYGIFPGDGSGGVADAVVEIATSPTSISRVKMLRVDVRPSLFEVLYSSSPDINILEKLTLIFVTAMQKTLEISNNDPFPYEIKFYGRHSMLLSLLTELKDRLRNMPEGRVLQPSIEGRWLVLRPIRKGN